MAEIDWSILGKSESIEKSREPHRKLLRKRTSGLLPSRWKMVGGIHREPTSVSHPDTIPLTSPRSARLVKIPSPHRQQSTTVSRAEPCAVNNPPFKLTHFRSTWRHPFLVHWFLRRVFPTGSDVILEGAADSGVVMGGASVPRLLKTVSTRKSTSPKMCHYWALFRPLLPTKEIWKSGLNLIYSSPPYDLLEVWWSGLQRSRIYSVEIKKTVA